MQQPTENEMIIRKRSRYLRRFFQLCLVTLPLVPAVFWLGYNLLPNVVHAHAFPGETVTHLQLNSRLIALAGSLPAIIVLALALTSLARLFALYERGTYFQTDNVREFRLLGKLACWAVVADVAGKSVLTVARTINNPPGQRMISLGLSGEHVKLMVVATIILLIGMVMDEARRIHDEHELTV